MPCFNEESGIRAIFKSRPSLIDEIVVIDNNSTDGTSCFAKQGGAKVVFLEKRGYGMAYAAGLPHTTGDIIIMMDGDNSYPLSGIENFLYLIEEKKYDFLTGCRFPLKNKNAMPMIKRVANKVISSFIRNSFGIPLVDSQSGMFVVSREIIDKIVPKNNGMAFTHEIKIRAWLDKDILCGEIHIDYGPRIGKVKYRPIRDGGKTLLGAIKLAWYFKIMRRNV